MYAFLSCVMSYWSMSPLRGHTCPALSLRFNDTHHLLQYREGRDRINGFPMQ